MNTTILIMIIIGVVSSVFGKGKGKGNNPNPNPKPKPFSVNSLDEFRKLFENPLTNEVPEETEMLQPDQKEFQRTHLKNSEEKYRQMKQIVQTGQVEWTNQPAPVQQRPTRAVKRTNVEVIEEEDKSFFSKNPGAKDVINGIIWAEILGEPRSKKPYSSR